MNFLKRDRFAVPILLVAGLILRLPNFNRSLWYDEVNYATSEGAATLDHLWRFVVLYPPAPFYRIFMYGWNVLVGNSEIAVRAPSLVFGLASIWLLYEIAKRFGKEFVPFLAALLLCISAVHIWYSQEATPYSMTICLLLWTIFSWIKLQKTPDRRGWYFLYASLLLITIFTHFLAAAFLVPLTIMSLPLEKKIRNRIIVIHAFVSLCLVANFAAKFYSGHLIAEMPYLRPFSLFQWWMLFFHWFAHGNSIWTLSPYGANFQHLMQHPSLFVFQLFLFCLCLLGMGYGRGKENFKQKIELALYLLSLPLSLLILSWIGLRHTYIERYMLVLLPFYLIAIAKGTMAVSNRTMRFICICVLMGFGVASYMTLLIKETEWTVYKHNPDWRSTVASMSKSSFGGSVVLVTTPSDDLIYYLRKTTMRGNLPVKVHNAKRLNMILSNLKIQKIYMVENLYWMGDSKNTFSRLKEDEQFHLANVSEFQGVRLNTFIRKKRTAK